MELRTGWPEIGQLLESLEQLTIISHSASKVATTSANITFHDRANYGEAPGYRVSPS
jgi:hypothetical protein